MRSLSLSLSVSQTLDRPLKPPHVYVRRNKRKAIEPSSNTPLPPTPRTPDLPLPFTQESYSPTESTPLPNDSFDLGVPRTLHKGKSATTQHPISNFLSFDQLSTSLKLFVMLLSSIFIPKSYQEALAHP